MRRCWIFVSVAMLMLLNSCSQRTSDPLAQQSERHVWPQAPAQARVRYLGQLRGSSDYPDRRHGLRDLLLGPQPPSMMATPIDVAVSADGSRVAVADPNGPCVHLFNLKRRSYQRIGEAESSDTQPILASPVAVAWGDDALWIVDADRRDVARWTETGGFHWLHVDGLDRPADIVFDGKRKLLDVVDAGDHCVVTCGLDGQRVRTVGKRGGAAGELNFPTHAALSDDGDLWVSDSLNFRVQRFSADGEPRGGFGSKGDAAGDFSLPKGIAVDRAGNVWVVDAQFENVQAFNPESKLLITIGEEGSQPGQFWLPAGACIDSRNRLWIADSYNRRVQVFELLP